MTAEPERDDAEFIRRLGTRVTQLRLRVDLGELRSPAAFREALLEGGEFTLDDTRVQQACWSVGLGHWLASDAAS